MWRWGKGKERRKCDLPADDDLEIVAGAQHRLLGFFVAQLEDVFVVYFYDAVADVQAGLLCQTANVHLERRCEATRKETQKVMTGEGD